MKITQQTARCAMVRGLRHILHSRTKGRYEMEVRISQNSRRCSTDSLMESDGKDRSRQQNTNSGICITILSDPFQ